MADAQRGAWGRVAEDVADALDGQAAEQHKVLVPRQARRETGAFFTAGHIKAAFAHELDRVHPGTRSAWDPACGAGDLLLCAATGLDLATTVGETVRVWSRALRGHDLDDAYIQTTRTRLLLAALHRHHLQGDPTVISHAIVQRAFGRVQVGDGLAALRAAKRYSGAILLNPPYTSTQVGSDCSWSSGRTSFAAIFTLAAAQALRPGSTLLAILPDVLRSGSRYERWRMEAESWLDIDLARPLGQFDNDTDIDVVLLNAVRAHRASRPTSARATRGKTGDTVWQAAAAPISVADHFEVKVGNVVDYRDPRDGRLAPYLIARDLPPQGISGTPDRLRAVSTPLIQPPFVALRRTSRPHSAENSGERAAGVLIKSEEAIAVDNHLVVARPLDGTEETCRRLLDLLERQETTAWLDARIRCRHLTVAAVREIPWL